MAGTTGLELLGVFAAYEPRAEILSGVKDLKDGGDDGART